MTDWTVDELVQLIPGMVQDRAWRELHNLFTRIRTNNETDQRRAMAALSTALNHFDTGCLCQACEDIRNGGAL